MITIVDVYWSIWKLEQHSVCIADKEMCLEEHFDFSIHLVKHL